MRMRRLVPILSILYVLVIGASLALAQERPAGWEDYSHSNETDPDYEVVFPQDAVNTITISISPENWQAMQSDMTTLFGEFGAGMERGGAGFPRMPRGEGGFQPPAGAQPPENGMMPPGGFGVGGVTFAEENPMWVAADVTFNGQTWTNVGLRYKGNSTLAGAWGAGSLKLGFKLNFDKFEDDYPAIKNQRFFGFDEMSFSSNYRDASYLHEKIAADLYREAGIPAAQTSFYAVYMDYGDGPVYVGLYTAVEVIEDTMLSTQFGDDSGNLYKPEGTGASFQAGTFAEDDFEKQSNEDAADYSDILALFEALHADNRTTDPAAWRAGLEAVFDVDGFVRWLAVNTVIQNWDTYGTMAHNYYLYNDPASGLLTWIPWDNNEALSGGGMGWGMGRGSSDSLDHAGVTATWPLIRYLMDDPVYYAQYVVYVEDTANRVYSPDKMIDTFEKAHALIAPYVTGEAAGEVDPLLESVDAFEQSLATLIDHVNQRFTAAQAFVTGIAADS